MNRGSFAASLACVVTLSGALGAEPARYGVLWEAKLETPDSSVSLHKPGALPVILPMQSSVWTCVISEVTRRMSGTRTLESAQVRCSDRRTELRTVAGCNVGAGMPGDETFLLITDRDSGRIHSITLRCESVASAH